MNAFLRRLDERVSSTPSVAIRVKDAVIGPMTPFIARGIAFISLMNRHTALMNALLAPRSAVS
jgi:hypothetical protein